MPNPQSQAALLELESRHTSGVYHKRPLALVRGLGARAWDAEGREYIDCAGGQGAANLGHSHPAVVAAISRQAATLISCPEIFYNDQRAQLMAALAAVAPAGLNRVFLCNSGAEANEAALKFARLSTGRIGVVAAMRSFHGRTMGALSATWNKEYRQPFEPLVPGFSHVPYNDPAALDAAVGDDTAAVLLEVVQGEGGVHLGTPEYLAGAQALCRARGAMLLVDEVQTGYGRTGRLFACEHHGLEPDLMTVAKSMAGGLPMGACLIGPRVANIRPGVHGSTFGGNPLACAAALAVLEVMAATCWKIPDRRPATDDQRNVGQVGNLAYRAAYLGERLMERLRRIESPLIREVRGLGLLVGIELKVKVTPILQKLQGMGVLALPAGATVLRLLPPLVIEQDDLDRVVDAIGQALVGD
jgi:acetylornithine/LysW-gamma-L-lysine aminotransferase